LHGGHLIILFPWPFPETSSAALPQEGRPGTPWIAQRLKVTCYPGLPRQVSIWREGLHRNGTRYLACTATVVQTFPIWWPGRQFWRDFRPDSHVFARFGLASRLLSKERDGFPGRTRRSDLLTEILTPPLIPHNP
jgi:hypothetical protein